jgi:hypothetical protein
MAILQRTTRMLAGAAAGALLLTPLAGCSHSDAVSCSGTSCTVTLDTDDAKVSVLGHDLTFGGIQDGRASLSVGDKNVSCAQGDSVSAGPLSLTCTTITDDSVELTAKLA